MRDELEKARKLMSSKIKSLSVKNVELKEYMVWYETKYDGAEENEEVLVNHTNSLADRLCG